MSNYQNTLSQVKTSVRVLQIGMAVIFVGFLVRLIQLQIIDYEKYNPISERNSVRQEVINPARGLIFDRNGSIIVENTPVYTIYVTPTDFKSETIPLLARLMGTSQEVIQNGINRARRYSAFRPSRLFTEVEFDVFSRIEENIWQLPGISHQIESKRNYPEEVNLAHVLGYLREITEQEYQQSDIYRLGDKSGRSGIELTYEQYLRGETGTSYRKINAYGQGIGPFEDGLFDVNPSKGFNIHTSIDLELQKLAERLLKGKVGGLVALDPNTGEILAMVSSPDYEIERLSGRLDRTYWNQVNADTLRPLFNRAITATMQPPGSTFKPIMGLVGLRLGVITPETRVFCNGGYYRGRLYRCTGQHGNQTLEEALMNSCNTYFFSLMNRIMMQYGIDDWNAMIKRFGLGRLNHIDLPGETAGILPDSLFFDSSLGVNRWGLGDLINLGVGQGSIGVSPLQMALVAAEIGNGGYWVQPHVVKYIDQGDAGITLTNPQKTRIEWIREEDLRVVQQGLRLAVTEGSGRFYANLKDIPVSGKTGTAQNLHGNDHGWFISYAPSNNPEIAVAVIIENGGFGSVSAAPIASLITEQYLTGTIKRPYLVTMMLNFVARDSQIHSD